MRIAIIASGFLPVLDGVTVSGMRRLEQLSAKGHEVLFLCPDTSPLEALYPNWRDYVGRILPGVEVVTLESAPFAGTDFDRNPTRRSHRDLQARLRAFSPDIIHVDEPERLFVGFLRRAGRSYARANGIPCVAFFRTNFVEYFEDVFRLPRPVLSVLERAFIRLLAFVYNAYDRTLVSSAVTEVKLRGYGIRNTLLADLHGVDRNGFGPRLRRSDFFRDEYSLEGVDATVKLVFVGRLTADKNWKFTFQALEACAAQGLLEGVSVIVAGDGDMRDEIRERLERVSRNVHLLGRVAPEAIPALMANSDVHVTTSEKETRGLTLLEAFVSGIPVLAPAAGGVVQNVVHGRNGFLFAPSDAEDFVKRLGELVRDPALRHAMGRAALEGNDLLDWKGAVSNLVEIWEKEIARKRARASGLHGRPAGETPA